MSKFQSCHGRSKKAWQPRNRKAREKRRVVVFSRYMDVEVTPGRHFASLGELSPRLITESGEDGENPEQTQNKLAAVATPASESPA